MNIKNALIVLGIGALAVFGIVRFSGDSDLGVKVLTDRQTFLNGFDVDANALASVFGGDLTIGDALSVSGQTAVEGFTKGGANTTLTDANGGTYTLTEAELLASGVLTFAASGAGQEVIALAMPATSTMTTLIPNSGDCREWLYDASALAAATTTTLTLGTGHNIIAYTTNDDVIDGAEFAEIKMCRKANGDVNTIVSELLHAD